MKQFKKLKKVWALMLALVMMLPVVPAETAWAADKYAVKGYGEKSGVLFVSEDGAFLNVDIYKNGKSISQNKKEAKKVKWKSSNSSVVKFYFAEGCSAGVLPNKKGTATITATYRGKSCSFKITVKGATLVVGDSQGSKGYVPAGQTLEMRAWGEGWNDSEKTGTIRYSSSNSAVAKVVSDNYGDKVIKGLKEGTATITAKSKLGTLKCTVTVLPAMKLQVKNVKDVKKNGKVTGFSCEVVNKSAKAVTILDAAGSCYEGYSSAGKIKGGSQTIKAGQSKKITVNLGKDAEYESWDSEILMSVKYAGHEFCGSYFFPSEWTKGGFSELRLLTWKKYGKSWSRRGTGGAG